MIQKLKNHKKPLFILGGLLFLYVFVWYLQALFAPGFWHRDTFLYQQKDGSFSGSEFYADYHMNIIPTETGYDISFSVNDTVNCYQIFYDADDTNHDVQIFENDTLVFQGKALKMGEGFLLVNEEGEPHAPIQIVVETTYPSIPETKELFPGYTRLFNLATAEEYDTRGTPMMLLFIAITVLFLAIDIRFPDLLFQLKYGLAVDGGTPSDYYRTMQKAGRIILLITIPIYMILSFTVH